ncbi:lysylphosphatidylglycerol synthase transmembrane domain-containing protein [Kytococcus sp. Marseille-QA3725]
MTDHSPGSTAISALDDDLDPQGASLSPARIASAFLGLGIAGTIIIWGLPWIADTTWTQIGTQLGRLSGPNIAWLTGLTSVAVLFYTLVMTGSIRGLKTGQAVISNLVGTMISTTFPLGGAVGVGATYAMFRSWGFPRKDVSSALTVIGVWNILGRAALPAIAAAWMLYEAVGTLPRQVVLSLMIGGGAGGGLLVGFVLAVASRTVAGAIGSSIGWLASPFIARLDVEREDFRQVALDLRERIATTVRTGGWTMTLGMAGFLGFYAVVFWLCLRFMGVDISPVQAFAAYAVGRLLTAFPVTPGSMGVTEAGALAILVAGGASPAGASAAGLLFSLFTNVLHVPAGVVAGAVWILTAGRAGNRPGTQ